MFFFLLLLTLTNRFDVLVNGGGAVTLQFQRSPFRPLTRTVFVPWNQIVVLPPVQMQLSEDEEHLRPLINRANSAANGIDAYSPDSKCRNKALIWF
uniref:Teneurin TTR-like domain-containing protein n=1 Tax=Phlebotomus papatasi TaxID=29031 RepID=A0A1B0DH66_PHLPP